ncbi:MAG: hypothetical protein ACRC0X_05680 [Brevinema sp.]
MPVFKFLFVLTVLLFYGLLFTEQRIESREKTREIIRLTQKLEIMNARKQELVGLIDQERARLVKQAETMGTKLSPKDVIIIE